jgi:predicted transposase/invertase (TIGR01784 family)
VEQGIIPPRYDFVFKKLFGDKDHVETTAAFLKAVLNLSEDECKTLTLGDPTLYPRYIKGKRFVLDLKIETASGKLIDIEIQLNDTGEIPQRIAAYESRLLGDQLSGGDDYKELNKVITILITGFPLIRETDAYHKKFMIRSEDGIVLTDIFEIYIIELNKIPHIDDGSKLWPWLKFLKATRTEELDMLQQHYPELREPVVHLKELSADELMREEQWAYEKACRDDKARIYYATKQGEAKGKAEGKAEGIIEGEAKGKAEGIAEVAMSMLQEGMPAAQVARFTGLTPEEINNLQTR